MRPATWLRLWIHFLKLNPNYKAYCIARRAGDTATCTTLEVQHARLNAIYADLGDLYEVDTARSNTESYFKWWMGHRHFFTPIVSVKTINDHASYKPRSGHLLMEVSLTQNRKDVVAKVESFLADVYEHRIRIMEESKFDSLRLATQPVPPPKYAMIGKVSKATAGAVSKAIYANLHCRTKLSMAETVLAMMRDPKNPFGWKLTAIEEQDIAKGRFKLVSIDTEVKLLRRARKDFDALVKNTLEGRFPDFL